MAQLAGLPQSFPFDTASRASSEVVKVGTIANESGTAVNEWIFLRGTASVIAGSWVRFAGDFTTERTSSNNVGPLAIAGTANTVDTYGWFQIKGLNTQAQVTGSVNANSALYLAAASAMVDDADVGGDLIEGAISRAASSGSAVTVWLNYPIVYDVAQD